MLVRKVFNVVTLATSAHHARVAVTAVALTGEEALGTPTQGDKKTT